MPGIAKCPGGEVLAESVLPILGALATDQNDAVKLAVAKSMVMLLCVEGMPSAAIAKALAPVFGADASKEVKIAALEALENVFNDPVNSVTTAGLAHHKDIFTSIASLHHPSNADYGQADWRIRRGVAALSGAISEVLGQASFSSTVEPMVLDCLEDEIAEVRLATAKALGGVAKFAGGEWVASTLVPKLTGLYASPGKKTAVSPGSNSSYLQRITVLNALGATVADDLEASALSSAMDVLVKGVKDPIANVRFNAIRALADVAERSAGSPTAAAVRLEEPGACASRVSVCVCVQVLQ